MDGRCRAAYVDAGGVAEGGAGAEAGAAAGADRVDGSLPLAGAVAGADAGAVAAAPASSALLFYNPSGLAFAPDKGIEVATGFSTRSGGLSALPTQKFSGNWPSTTTTTSGNG